MGQFFDGWVASESQDHDAIKVKRLYVDINEGNWYDAAVFSQIMYWHGRNKETGERRMTIFRDGEFWLAKRYEDWWVECRVNAETAKKAIARMVKRKLLIKKVWLFAGKPMVHLRIDIDAFEVLANHCLEEVKESSLIRSNVPDGKGTIDQMDQVHRTDLYTETTTETTESVSAASAHTELTDPDPDLDGIPDHISPAMMRQLGFNAKLTPKAEKVRRQQDVEKLTNNPVWQAYAKGWDGIEPTMYPAQAAAYLRFCNTLQARMDNQEFTLADIEGCTREQLPKPRLGSYLIDYVPVDISDYMRRKRIADSKKAATEDGAVPDEWGVDTFVRKPESEAA